MGSLVSVPRDYRSLNAKAINGRRQKHLNRTRYLTIREKQTRREMLGSDERSYLRRHEEELERIDMAYSIVKDREDKHKLKADKLKREGGIQRRNHIRGRSPADKKEFG